MAKVVAGMALIAAISQTSITLAAGTNYEVDYRQEIDLMSSYNRPITLSLAPNHFKEIDYVPDLAIVPCTKDGVLLPPTKRPPRKCHWLFGMVGNDMPSLVFVLDGQQVMSIIQEEPVVNGKRARRVVRSWEKDRNSAPRVNGPNPALYDRDHR